MWDEQVGDSCFPLPEDAGTHILSHMKLVGNKDCLLKLILKYSKIKYKHKSGSHGGQWLVCWTSGRAVWV